MIFIPLGNVVDFTYVGAIAHIAYDGCLCDLDDRESDHLPLDLSNSEASWVPQAVMRIVTRACGSAVQRGNGRPTKEAVLPAKDPHGMALAL